MNACTCCISQIGINEFEGSYHCRRNEQVAWSLAQQLDNGCAGFILLLYCALPAAEGLEESSVNVIPLSVVTENSQNPVSYSYVLWRMKSLVLQVSSVRTVTVCVE